MTGDRESKRKKGTIVGCAMIALGLITAVWSYFRDSGSLDFTSMTHAADFAVLHAVLWGLAGGAVILWYNRDPDSDPPPPYERDDQG